MGKNYDMADGSPATGGIAPPNEMPTLPVYPDQTPGLSDPTQRPNEPITDGLALGAGRGPEALTNYDPRLTETQALKKWLPILDPIGNDESTPDSVRTLIRYIRGA
jgi:hypothetical protein